MSLTFVLGTVSEGLAYTIMEVNNSKTFSIGQQAADLRANTATLSLKVGRLLYLLQGGLF